MRICQITSMHKWDDARIYQRACKHLAASSVQVDYIATQAEDENIPYLNVYPLKLRTGWRRRWFSSLEAYNKARKIPADIYHFHDPDLMPWMFLLSLQGKKVIYDIHENFYEKFHKLPIPFKWFFNFLYSVYELPIRNFAGIVSISDSLLAKYKKKSKQRLVVMNVTPKKVFDAIETQERSFDDFVIYVSGQQSEKRNVTQLVEALPAITKAYPNTVLKLVGRYVPLDYDNFLRKKAKELNVEQHLELEGMLPWEENFKRTAKATLGCVFYEDNPNNRVGIPNRIFEYMACGIPILAENFTELRKIVNHTQCGLLVNSSNPEEIAFKCIELLSDKDRIVEMGKRGRIAALQQYNFDNELSKLIDFYKKIINQ